MVLASYIRPFDAKQKIYVLNDKKDTEEIRLADLDTFAETVLQLMNEYSIDTLELHGIEDICKGTAREIVKAEQTKYSVNKLNIEIKGA